MNDFDKIVEEYSKEYCLLLEVSYSEGMMSEGGEKAIDRMFSAVDLKNKCLLDIGFGLGGVAFYLAKKHAAKLVGIELGAWMVEEATRRAPDALKESVKFIQYVDPPLLPLAHGEFDVVFSKGVLTHVREKHVLFQEIYRVLKPGGAWQSHYTY